MGGILRWGPSKETEDLAVTDQPGVTNGKPKATDDKPKTTNDEPRRAAWIVGTTIVGVIAFLALSSWIARFFSEEVRMSFLIVAGFVALVGLLGGIAIAFRSILLAGIDTSGTT